MAKFTSLIPAVSVPTEGEFNKHPVLTLPNPDDPKQPGVQLGVKKIRAVLAYTNECDSFVAKHFKPKSVNGDATKAKVKDVLANIGNLSKEEIEKALASI